MKTKRIFLNVVVQFLIMLMYFSTLGNVRGNTASSFDKTAALATAVEAEKNWPSNIGKYSIEYDKLFNKIYENKNLGENFWLLQSLVTPLLMKSDAASRTYGQFSLLSVQSKGLLALLSVANSPGVSGNERLKESLNKSKKNMR